MYFRPYENTPKSQAEAVWFQRIQMLGAPLGVIRKPFWYKHVRVYIYPTSAPGVAYQPGQWHAQFWAGSSPTITSPSPTYGQAKRLAKRTIRELKG